MDNPVHRVTIGEEPDIVLFNSGGNVVLRGDGWRKTLATYGTNKQNRLCAGSFIAGIIVGLKLEQDSEYIKRFEEEDQ